jgi:hypothetical protein
LFHRKNADDSVEPNFQADSVPVPSDRRSAERAGPELHVEHGPASGAPLDVAVLDVPVVLVVEVAPVVVVVVAPVVVPAVVVVVVEVPPVVGVLLVVVPGAPPDPTVPSSITMVEAHARPPAVVPPNRSTILSAECMATSTRPPAYRISSRSAAG